MYVIMVYDIREERVNKVLKIARKYLTWVQNSVLEGELTRAQLEKLKVELGEIIDKEEDSVIFYKLRSTAYFQKETMGVEKGGGEQFI